MKTAGWQMLNKELFGEKQTNLILFPKSWKIYAKVKTHNSLGDYISCYFRALQALILLLTLVIFFFFLQIVVWKKAQPVSGLRR